MTTTHTTRSTPTPHGWMPTLGLLLAATFSGACAPHMMQSVVAPATTSGVTVPGVPALPDVVTVIPFRLYKGKRGDWPGAWVEFPAEIDGVRGTYELDTGAGPFWINGDSLPPNPATAHLHGEQRMNWTVHTERLGTLVAHMNPMGLGPPISYGVNAHVGVNYDTSASGNSWRPGAGSVGLDGMEPFETIIDYVHQRLIFIRLDSAGRRLAEVPAYPPAGTVPLVPVTLHAAPMMAAQWWGIEGLQGGVLDTLFLDSGTQTETGFTKAQQELVADQLQRAMIAESSAGRLPANGIALPGPRATDDMNILGYFFLARLGVVGFNLRTRQIILYKEQK